MKVRTSSTATNPTSGEVSASATERDDHALLAAALLAAAGLLATLVAGVRARRHDPSLVA